MSQPGGLQDFRPVVWFRGAKFSNSIQLNPVRAFIGLATGERLAKDWPGPDDITGRVCYGDLKLEVSAV